MALNANALTSLSFAKMYLKIPSGETSLDQIVEFWINVSSQMLESETDRKLKAQSHVEFISGRKSNLIVPMHWPINSVSELKIDDEVIDSSDYIITDEDTTILLKNRLFPLGYSNIKLSYNAGFTSVPSDLENACLWMITYYHKMRDTGDIGRTSKSKGDESVNILQNAPQDVKDIIMRYKRCEFANLPRDIKNE